MTATVTIGELDPAGPITGQEWIEIEQDGVSVRALISTMRGQQGANGLSAYQVAVGDGFNGTLSQWLATLKGAKGDTGNTGIQGKSAFASAVTDGFVGTESQWVLSLHGAKGDAGLSAYEVAQAGGFVGTQAAWLLSLKGAQGDRGIQGLDGLPLIPKGQVPAPANLPVAAAGNTNWMYTALSDGHMYVSNGAAWVDFGLLGSGGGGGALTTANIVPPLQEGDEWVAPSADSAYAVAVGNEAVAVSASVAIGALTTAGGSLDVVIGANGKSDASGSSVAIGAQAEVSDGQSTALGNSSKSAAWAVAAGFSATATELNSVAIGAIATANGQSGVAVGSGSKAGGDDQAGQATALGQGAQALHLRSVAIGASSATQTQDEVSIGIPAALNGGTERTRRLTHVAPGVDPSDAVTKAQLDAGGGVTTANLVPSASVEDFVAPVATVNGVAVGGRATSANWGVSVGASSTSENGVSIGAGATSTETGVTLGSNGETSNGGGVAVGQQTKAINQMATAVGAGAEASGYSSTVVGDHAVATNDDAIAVGASSTASAVRSIAVGDRAEATHANSVALGHGSKTTTFLQVSVGTPAGADPEAEPAILRRVSLVADPVDDHDAVTKASLTAALVALISGNDEVKAAIMGLASVSIRDLNDAEIARAFAPLPVP